MIRPTLLVALLTSCLITDATPGILQEQIITLEQGRPVEGEMKAGEVNRFRVSLKPGQFLQVLVQQIGIRLALALVGPGGKRVAEQTSSYGRRGPILVSLVADEPDYTIEVRSAENDAPAGRYEISIAALREPTSADRSRIAAENALREGRALRSQPTEESRRKALEKFQEALPHWRDAGDRSGEANTLQSIGITYRLLGEMREAIKYYGLALSLQKAAGGRRGEGFTLNYIGLAHAYLGEFNKAQEYYDQALALWQAEDDRLNLSETYNRMGGVYSGIGDLQKAMSYYQMSLQLRQETVDLAGEAQTLNNIAEIYYNSGEAQRALNSYDRALYLFRQVKDRRAEAITLNNIGYVHASFGDFQEAKGYFEQARAIRKDVYDPIEEASTIVNIGQLFFSSGDFKSALEYYEQALAIEVKLGNNRGIAYALIYTGQAHASLGHQQEALKSYEQALSRFEEMGDQQGRASALDKMAEVFAVQGRLQDSLDNYKKALQAWRAVGDRRGEATSLYGIARLERDRGNLADALKNSEAALSIVESLRSKIASPQLRMMYLAAVRDYYVLNIDARMKLRSSDPSAGHDARALEASEQSRARSLIELLNEAHADIRQKVDFALLEQERFLQQEIDAKERAHIRLLSGKHTAQEAAAAEKELSNLIIQEQGLLTEVKIKNPGYAALTQPQPLTLKEIQQQVLDPDTLLLEYSLGDDRSYLWAVTQTSINSFELPGRAELEAQAKLVYKLLTARLEVKGETIPKSMARVAQADKDYWPQAARLSQMLMGAVASQLGEKRLLIVAEGALQYIPFSALPVPTDEAEKMSADARSRFFAAHPSSFIHHPLVIDHEIVNLPSASVLAILRREIAGRKPAAKAIAVLADPVFEKNDSRIKSSKNKLIAQSAKQPASAELSRALRDVGITGYGMSLQRLRSTRREAEAIQAVVPAKDSFEALDFMANRRIATSPDLAQYRIVHFATHGLLNNEHPELSGIVLSLFDEQGNQQNGFLRLHDIYNLNLPAELVVLSACSTGLGKEIRGEGLVGLTRGFMYAGAARVMASLWNVNDLATANLMKRFYKAVMTDELPPAAALRKAQVEMWKSQPWKAPYYWAAFVLQGEWK